ncbi:outer membrane protein [Roseibium marinum]|uniref:Opacity protein-like surface antigen n=1 Tax=Roseibium marinum TaxID=281252 RepID=A0A2S3V270_9HYPH|nr:outer membrane beta-barrel protein [Roseibium marinum]POF34046.1 opacity protein-like surface antigen [Roseibium marinum]
MRFLPILGLFLLGSTSSSLAADAPAVAFGTVENLRLERSDWSGFSGVLFAGGAFLNVSGTAESTYNTNKESNFERSGTFGGSIGYDHQFNQLVLGAHLEGMVTNFPSDASKDLSVQGKWLSSGTVRLGFDAGRFMPYVSAGVGYGRLQVDHETRAMLAEDDLGSPPAARQLEASYSKTALALVLGGGLEARIHDGFFARADYKHFRFDDIQFNLDGFPATTMTASNNIDVFNLGLGYRY